MKAAAMATTAADNSKKPPGEGGRARQKERTRRAIVDASRELTRSGAEVTMPRIAERAMVSEATMYRYFPDLNSLLGETLAGLWPDPAEALAPVAASRDPAERVAFACEFLLRGVHAYQGSVRAAISVVVSAEAFFTLTDLCGLAPDDAIASAVRTATTLTRAAFDSYPERARVSARPPMTA
jgi:AcrR family transcriptional regulator